MTLDREAAANEVAAVEAASPLSPNSTLFVPNSRRAWTRLGRGRPDRLARQRRHVVGRGGASGGADRIRRLPRHSVARLYHGDARLRFRRRADRKNQRSLRHRHRDRARRRYPRPRLYRGGDVVVDLAIHSRAFCHRPERIGDVRAADGRSLALVRSLPGACRHDRRKRKLYRRHDLAAAGELGHAVVRLAHHPYRHRHLHRDRDDARGNHGCGC